MVSPNAHCPPLPPLRVVGVWGPAVEGWHFLHPPVIRTDSEFLEYLRQCDEDSEASDAGAQSVHSDDEAEDLPHGSLLPGDHAMKETEVRRSLDWWVPALVVCLSCTVRRSLFWPLSAILSSSLLQLSCFFVGIFFHDRAEVY